MSQAEFGHIPDHEERAIGELPGWQREEPNLTAMVRLFSCEVQQLEDALFDVWMSRTLDGANGAQLDVAASLLGVERQGMADLDLRGLCKAAALSMVGSGSIDRLLEIVSAGTRVPIGYVEIENLRRAVIITYVTEGAAKPLALRTQLKAIVEASTPPGTNIQLIEAAPNYLGLLEDVDGEGFEDGLISTAY